MRIRVGFLGAGPRGRAHAQAYAGLVDRVELVAVADLDAERRDAFAEEFAIPRRYESYPEMLQTERLEVLHIAAPVTVRTEPIRAAAEAGVPLIVSEKPIAVHRREYDTLLQIVERAGAQLVINHQLRYQTNWQKVYEAVSTDRLGEVRRILVSCRGNLLSQGTHLLDLVVMMVGDPGPGRAIATVYGEGDFATTHPSPDNSVGVLLFESGLVVDCFLGPDAPPILGEESFWLTFGMRVLGEEGRAEASLEGGYRLWGRGDSRWEQERIDYGKQDREAQAAFTADLLRVLEEPGFRHPCDARVGRISYEWLEALALSGGLSTPVRFPLPEGVSGLAMLAERARARRALGALTEP
ncbi:MAG: hypothetical protein KatS3mg115_1797 [Candidatus Poribacteria bacterium]|nr:MAG: hypothetical protein KatS3mg115_1797 [Candidatus Poribacteria bacterium]